MSKRVPTKTEPDVESTAELPILEGGAPASGDEPRQSATDTWIVPPPAAARASAAPASAGAPGIHPPEGAVQTLSARLHESQGLLSAKEERIRQLERSRDEALEARAAAERRATQLDHELAQLRSEHAFQLDEHARARAHFEEQLAQARALLSAASARADERQRRVTELENAARSQHDHDLQHEQRVAQDRARVADVRGELRNEREWRLTLTESLQSAESRRAILEQLVTDLHREGEEREGEFARVARTVVGRDAHVRELEAELGQRAARIARLEQQVSSLTEALAEREGQLQRSLQETRALQEVAASLRSQLGSASERVRTLQTLAAEHGSSGSKQQGELERLKAERAELGAALESARAATLAARKEAAGNDAALQQLRERNAELESALTEERRRAQQLEEASESARREMQHWAGALQTTQQERNTQTASVTAAEARIKALEERATEREEAMRALQSESSASVARARELEADLHAAEEAVHRLESETRTRKARLEELERANVRWRALEEARHAAAESAAGYAPAPQEPATAAQPEGEVARARAGGGAAAAPAAEPAPDGAARLLIRSDGERELVHVLGRRTSIGRTPDNDLQIDAQFISRHHAVILVGPVHTLIEDLNSTNGVQVNGRRVTRQILKDGDIVHIARLQYRFTVRKGSEKR
jgi:chromosome segregation ATPase